MEKGLNMAISFYGSAAALAREMGVTRGHVSHWVTGRHLITPERCKQLEDLTKGRIKRADLRPDLFK